MIRYPIASEKSMRLIEDQNTLSFVVDRKDDKKKIKEEVEKMFKVKVEKVRTLIDRKGKKRAFVKLKKEYKAADVAAKLGLM